jgi:hypothetical protein
VELGGLFWGSARKVFLEEKTRSERRSQRVKREALAELTLKGTSLWIFFSAPGALFSV